MKRILFCLALVASLPASHAFASNVDFNIGINIGNRPPAVVPVPVPPPPPVAYAPPIVIEEPPLFIEPPELGFHVAVGIPYDVFYVGANYYLCKGNVWYSAPHYNGPWVVTRYKTLPWKLRRYPFEKVRYYRDAGYRHYRGGHDPYWKSHHFRPQHGWKEARRVERKWEKEQWKHERKDGRGGHGHGRY